MTALIDQNTRVICQGITGRGGTFYMQRAVAYGTKIVAGVTPGKGGATHLDVPVFNTVASAKERTEANASIIFVPPANAADAMIEAIEAEIPLVVCVTERVPVLDMVRVRSALDRSSTILVGPNSQGVLAPGRCMVGVMSTVGAKAGRIGIASRSASLTSEIMYQTSNLGLGLSTTIGIGGDPVHGIGFVGCLEYFLSDPDTEGVILIGEIGGTEEQEAAEFIKSAKSSKPIVALVAGRHAPQQRRMGHAGTITAFGRGDAEPKIDAFRSAGVRIAQNADLVAETMRQSLQS